MNIVTLSSKFQVVIPKEVREVMGLSSGAKLEILNYGNRIELVPLKSLSSLRGLYPGMDTRIDRGDRP